MTTKLRSAFALALAAADCASPQPRPAPTSERASQPAASTPLAAVEPAPQPPTTPAPAKLDKQIPVFGWLPPIADCAMMLEGEEGPISIRTPRGSITRPNPKAHPARIAKTLGKCDTSVQKQELAKVQAFKQPGVTYVFFAKGMELPTDDVAKSLPPLDTAEKAALHLILSGAQVRWYADPSGQIVEPAASGYATARCTGCSALETSSTPDGHAFLVIRSDVLEEAGCHRKFGLYRTVVVVAPDGTTKDVARTEVGIEVPFCVGRAPEGYVARSRATSEPEYFAALARDEAASIGSFERLARELRAYGAPEALALRAERAANDERRHTTMMAALAGIAANEVEVFAPPMHVRSLADVAIENAVEGCVRETYAALVTLDDATHAASRRVRAVMSRVAEDEIEHAELAFDVDAWMRSRLPAPTLREVDAAREAAIAELERADFPTNRVSGTRAQAFISTLRRLIWS